MVDKSNVFGRRVALNGLRHRLNDAFRVAEACVNNVGVDLSGKFLFSPFSGEVLCVPGHKCYHDTSVFMEPFWGGFDADEIIGDAIKHGGIC